MMETGMGNSETGPESWGTRVARILTAIWNVAMGCPPEIPIEWAARTTSLVLIQKRGKYYTAASDTARDRSHIPKLDGPG